MLGCGRVYGVSVEAVGKRVEKCVRCGKVWEKVWEGIRKGIGKCVGGGRELCWGVEKGKGRCGKRC